MFRKDTKGETDILHEIKTKELRESANRVLRLKTNFSQYQFLLLHLHGFNQQMSSACLVLTISVNLASVIYLI